MVLPFLIWIARALMYAQLRVQSVRMSPTQFPEGYRMVAEAAYQFGLRRVPDAYVVLGNGVINAFAAGHGFRRFVAINSDLFEVGGAVRDPDALRFVIGHEVGHIAAGHVSYLRLVFTNLLSAGAAAGYGLLPQPGVHRRQLRLPARSRGRSRGDGGAVRRAST